MNTVIVKNCKTLFIGRRGENEVTEVLFDFSEWQEQFGAGVIDLYVKRNLDIDAYPVVLSVDGTVATWLVSAADTDVVGNGKIEYVYTVNEKIAKSAIFQFFVGDDIGESSPEPPEHYQSWLEQLTELGAETQANAQAAAQSASEAAESASEAAESASEAAESAAQVAEDSNNAEAWAVGERNGEPVSEGDPTYDNNAKYWAENARANAPVQSVNGEDGYVVLTLDDIPNGETYVRTTPEQLAQIATNSDDIADVKATADTALQPDDLRPYRTAAAQDAIDQSQNTMIGIAIQGKQAKITASGILKGDGAGGVSSAVAGTDYATPQQVSEKYTKPSSGIPSTDMTAAVQASLIKADTALQAVPDTYRTAADQDLIDNGKQAKITASGILKGDGAGGVSAAVAGVDYLKSAPVTSVNGQTGDVTIQTATDAQVTTAVNTWLGENVAQETGYVLDASLTMSNAAPPASAVGDLKNASETITGATYASFSPNAIKIVTEGSTLNPNDLYTSANYVHAILPLKMGDTVTIYGSGGTGVARMYAICDENYKVLTRSVQSIALGQYLVSGIPGSAYIAINLQTANDHWAYYRDLSKDGLFMHNSLGVYTSDFSFTIPYAYDDRNMVVHALAEYVTADDSKFPTIQFMTGTGLNGTTKYVFGEKGMYADKAWRVNRYPGYTKPVTVNVVIPEGVTVRVKNFYNEYTNIKTPIENGLKIFGHRHLPNTPFDSVQGIEMAGKCGKRYFVEIPKRLSDGVWICYHDDTLVYNDTYIRQADGTELPSTYNGVAWSTIDYATAYSWDWGVSFDSAYTGTKPLTVEKFFEICSKTGIKPALSLHPFPSADQLGELKALAEKYGVLHSLTVKCSAINAYIGSLYSVFGNDVAEYVVNISAGAKTQAQIQGVINVVNNNLASSTVQKTIECFASTAYLAYFGESTYNLYELIQSAGLTASLSHQNGAYSVTNPGVILNMMQAADVIWWAKNHGVTEFTDDYNYSDGLNW